MDTKTVTLTPEVATEYLEHNFMNRNYRPHWAQALADEMASGNWKENGDTIVFDDHGNLVDGQHRLNAVIMSGYSYEALVVTNVDPIVRITMDAGNKRRFADDLTMVGEKNAATAETLLRKILTWKRRDGLAGKSINFSRSVLANEWPTYAKTIRNTIHDSRRFWRAPCGAGSREFMYWLLHHYAPADLVEQYFSILAIGSQQSEDKILVRLRAKLEDIRDDIGDATRKTRPMEEVYHMIRGWNAWVSGEQLKVFNLPRGWPLNPFPTPAKVVSK